MSHKDPAVDQYLAALPEDRAHALQTLREWIHQEVPEVSEEIRYRMPHFVTSDVVCGMAAQKQYLALYLCRADLLAEHAEALQHLNCGKGCIRFRNLEVLPEDSIRAIIRASAASPGYDSC